MNGIETKELIERKLAFDVRTAQFCQLGFDRLAAADFVIALAGKLTGPALDVGTGKGITAMALARQGLEVISVDTVAEEQSLAAFLVERAGLKDQIRFICGDASALPYPDSHFGCIAMMDVLHHLLDSFAVLNEIGRVLKPSGLLILADFTPEGFDILAQVHREEGREHSIVGISLDVAEALLSRKGFVTVSRQSNHKHEVLVLTKTSRCGGVR